MTVCTLLPTLQSSAAAPPLELRGINNQVPRLGRPVSEMQMSRPLRGVLSQGVLNAERRPPGPSSLLAPRSHQPEKVLCPGLRAACYTLSLCSLLYLNSSYRNPFMDPQSEDLLTRLQSCSFLCEWQLVRMIKNQFLWLKPPNTHRMA